MLSINPRFTYLLDKIVCTVSSLQGIQMLTVGQKHGVYWLVLEN